jgi:uncharacterized membrane protein YczE
MENRSRTWPALRKVVSVWAVLTIAVGAGYVAHLHSLPPDELVMADTLSFQVLVAAIFVGVPAMLLLLAFLLFGAVLKGLLQSKS